MFEFISDDGLGQITWTEETKFSGDGLVFAETERLINSGEYVEVPAPGPPVVASDYPEWAALCTLRSVLDFFQLTGQMSDTTEIDREFEVPMGGIA